MSLDELRRSARNLENTIESTLVSFANLVSSGAAAQHVPSATAEVAPAERLERELAANLEQVCARAARRWCATRSQHVRSCAYMSPFP
jgi:hypothetical protein